MYLLILNELKILDKTTLIGEFIFFVKFQEKTNVNLDKQITILYNVNRD